MEQHRAPARARAGVGRPARSGATGPTPEVGARGGAGVGAGPGDAAPGGGRLGDAALADEIELYGAVVVAASEKDGSLTDDEIDAALGVPPAARGGSRRPEGAERSR